MMKSQCVQKHLLKSLHLAHLPSVDVLVKGGRAIPGKCKGRLHVPHVACVPGIDGLVEGLGIVENALDGGG